MGSKGFITIVCFLLLPLSLFSRDEEETERVLLIGDSMTGWLAERLNAFGEENGFEADAVVWDGSTIKKWAAAAPRLKEIVEDVNPDMVLICLGLNELLERRPERHEKELAKIIEATGDRRIIWIGPPSWPGKGKGKTLNEWLKEQMGEDSFFQSNELELKRQSRRNPHPSRAGIETWAAAFAEWLAENTDLFGEKVVVPPSGKIKKCKNFIYKKYGSRL